MAKDLIKNGKAGKSSTSFSLIVIRDLSIRRQKVFRLAPGEQTPKQ